MSMVQEKAGLFGSLRQSAQPTRPLVRSIVAYAIAEDVMAPYIEIYGFAEDELAVAIRRAVHDYCQLVAPVLGGEEFLDGLAVSLVTDGFCLTINCSSELWIWLEAQAEFESSSPLETVLRSMSFFAPIHGADLCNPVLTWVPPFSSEWPPHIGTLAGELSRIQPR